MSRATQPEEISPPNFVSALRAGFDAVATHIHLILLPILLDLLLWFGPRLQLKSLIEAMQRSMNTLQPAANSGDMGEIFTSGQQAWTELANSFNLLSLLSTFPIGVPSLMAGTRPQASPLGQPILQDMPTWGDAVFLAILIALVGLLLGALFYWQVARVVVGESSRLSLGSLGWLALQTVGLTLIWIGLALVIYLPVICLAGFLSIFSPALGMSMGLVFTLLIIWLLLPLMFSPHGIFLYRQNAVASVLVSLRLVRFVFPATLMFFLSLVILTQGLNLLWAVPEGNPLFSLVGIAGHAFVTTALTAATFFFYLDAIHWVQSYLQKNLISKSDQMTA